MGSGIASHCLLSQLELYCPWSCAECSSLCSSTQNHDSNYGCSRSHQFCASCNNTISFHVIAEDGMELQKCQNTDPKYMQTLPRTKKVGFGLSQSYWAQIRGTQNPAGYTIERRRGRPLWARTARATPWNTEGGLPCAGQNGMSAQEPQTLVI